MPILEILASMRNNPQDDKLDAALIYELNIIGTELELDFGIWYQRPTDNIDPRMGLDIYLYDLEIHKLNALRNLEKDITNLFRILQQVPQLTHLCLYLNTLFFTISDRRIIAIANGIKSNTTLTTLHIKYAPTNEKPELPLLLEALIENSTLTQLKIEGAIINDTHILELATLISSIDSRRLLTSELLAISKTKAKKSFLELERAFIEHSQHIYPIMCSIFKDTLEKYYPKAVSDLIKDYTIFLDPPPMLISTPKNTKKPLPEYEDASKRKINRCVCS